MARRSLMIARNKVLDFLRLRDKREEELQPVVGVFTALLINSIKTKSLQLPSKAFRTFQVAGAGLEPTTFGL